MKSSSNWALALILWLPLAMPATAQTLQDDDGPAELPPSEFEGRRYVDSTGCVYIRAGVDNAVTWVPRVTLDRELVCGFQPTFAEEGNAAER